MEDIDLDMVSISPAAYQAWQEFARRVAGVMNEMRIVPQEIPDEQARVEDDGGLTIFVRLPPGDVSLRIPAGQWERRFSKN
ncbi:MAG: hypothetical protein HY482_00195 [Candidatus Wildermuthbacteria bacterium]|nr:hypothetical protein [Candidatus Wildermuthbacteria bacterium]